MKILVLDNFDSFTYNLVDYFRQLGCEVTVFRNTIASEHLDKVDFDLLVLSPGPSVPRKAGNMMQIIERFYRNKPILGVCLGHQALIEHFGGSLENIAPVHGKSVPIQHDGRGIFSGLEQGCCVARYHSWAGATVPPDFEVSAHAADGVVMAIRHKKLPIEGIQFHPESVLSMKNQAGMRMIQNVVAGRLVSGNQIYHELSSLLQGNAPIPPAAFRRFLSAVQDQQLSEDQKLILLVSLNQRLRQAPVLKSFIDVLMEFRSHAQVAPISDCVDICGTGGSGLPRINTSTLCSLLLAQAGLRIAKHGNRAAAGRFGSFNLLEALGLPPAFDAEKAEASLRGCNLAFVFAPDVHPVFKNFAPLRAKIGVPTIFNVLGPLVNPYLPERQFIGTAFADMMDVIFETAILMGKKHVIIVRGWDGLDEISISAPTRVLEYRDGQRFDYEISPADFGLESLDPAAVSASSGALCTEIAQSIIEGRTDTEHYKLVAANAAFIYSKFVAALPLSEAYQKMLALLKQGSLRRQLEQYKAISLQTNQPA
jgi:anthranilate synthase/phosphoribosyltransferase